MRSMTKTVLYTLIVSVGISGVLCILVILSRSWGEWQGRILNTTLTISGASLCALSCAALWERKNKKVVPALGLALTLIGASLVIRVLWFDSNNGAYWALTIYAAAGAVATSYLSVVLLTARGKRRVVLISGGLFILYNLVSGGGYVIENTDSLSTLNGVAEAKLTDETKVWLAETPTTKRIYVPFVFYYLRETYPFHLRFYGSTISEDTWVTDEKQLYGLSQLYKFNPKYTGPPIPLESCMPEHTIVVTEVLYHRQPDGSQAANDPPVFKVSSWGEIVITEPGEWIVESKGYEKHRRGEKKPVTFPTMTIRPTASGRIRVWRGVSYVVSQIMAIT